MGCEKLKYNLTLKNCSENAYSKLDYRFNGKELDPETGNYYYGARYYDPKISVWLSVDPLADQRPNLTPYNFTSNNPIMRIDPDGMLDEEMNNLPPDIVLINNAGREFARIITPGEDVEIQLDVNIELPSPIVVDPLSVTEELGIKPDAVGISIDYAGVVGGGMTGGLDVVYFLEGKDKGNAFLYGNKGGGVGLDAQIGVSGTAYKFNEGQAKSNFFSAKGLEGKYSGYSGGFGASFGYTWSNEGNRTALWPGQRGGTTTWKSYSLSGGIGGEIGGKVHWGENYLLKNNPINR